MNQIKLWEDKIIYCERCHRILTNHKSIKNKKGKICELKSDNEILLKEFSKWKN